MALRIAHLLPSTDVGGRERIVADLCRTAPAYGIDPLILTYDRPSEGTGIDFGDTQVVALDRRRSDFGAALTALLAERRIDLLHAQGHVAAALARGVSVPYVATLHVALGTGWRWLLPIARGLRGASAVTAVSGDLARRYARIALRRVETVPTGVDIDHFTPARLTGEGPFTIGIVARLHPVKRHCDALAAMRMLRARGVFFRLLLAGDGPARAAVARAAAGLDVEMLGSIDCVAELLQRLDAFLLCSDHEGTPAALLEAMAAGLPCVATRVGGIPAVAEGAALLVPPRSPAAIADALERLAVDPYKRARLGAAARERAGAFSIDRQARAYAELYASLLSAEPVTSSAPALRPWSGGAPRLRRTGSS
ncbi:MAG TPA: glycosyltransferase [Allosphingosinicella sp.]